MNCPKCGSETARLTKVLGSRWTAIGWVHKTENFWKCKKCSHEEKVKS
jgi:predicted nucleic-acid-binding Zn-ribbon protein